MQQGIVKWFQDARGFGFISPDGGGKDVFVHYSGINMKGHRKLQEGQRVSFEVEAGQKGPEARQVTVIG